MNATSRWSLLLVSLVLVTPAWAAADPPTVVNYQGVLRDASDKPRNGTFDMVFHFYDPTPGGEVMIDSHTAGGGNPVTVTNGLFNVQLGGGTITDGLTPGTYLSLADVFRDFPAVYLEIQVGAETLSPRIRVTSSAYALNASNLQGRPAANFLDVSGTSQTKNGRLILNDPSSGAGYGLSVSTPAPIAVFGKNTDGGGQGFLGYGNIGVWGEGSFTGGYFADPDNTGSAYVGYGDTGVEGNGNVAGGRFYDNSGNNAFIGTTQSGSGYGVDAYGTYAALRGYSFSYGIIAEGSYAGGYFNDGGTQTRISSQGYSINAVGAGTGASGEAYIYNPLGNGGSGVFVQLARSGTVFPGMMSNGSKSFAQNHPTDPTRIVVYAALEGGEAGTYTRGSGRLSGGEATIALDPTFALTTDPDIGLTAVVTPRTAKADLYVASVSTREVVVRSGNPDAGEVAFDYIVNGLRVGFELQPTILPKEILPNAPVPKLEAAEATLASLPEDVRRSTPASRFSASTGFAGARVLIAGINAPEQAKHARPEPIDGVPTVASRAEHAISGSAPAIPGSPSKPVMPPNTFPIAVAERVEPGDVLANDAEHPGTARRAGAESASAVIGIVAGEPGGVWSGTAPLALPGTIAICRADATLGPIAATDLLVASPNPGFAMRAGTNPKQGTVIGKALEPLEAGMGLIRVLVMSR